MDFFTFSVSVVASVVGGLIAEIICKWFDGKK